MPSNGPRRGLASGVLSGVRAFVLSDEPPEWFWKATGVGRPSLSGVTVTDQTALPVTSVLWYVKVLAESISTLPLLVFERQTNGDRRPRAKHSRSTMLHAGPGLPGRGQPGHAEPKLG